MNVRLSIAIMAHPARTQHAWWLSRELGAPIIWDQGAGEWDTGVRAIASYDVDATHHLVIQDDAVPVRGLRAQVEAALTVFPDYPVSLYLGTGEAPRRRLRNMTAMRRADEFGVSWIRVPHLLHGVAVVLPVGDIERLLRWSAGRREPYDDRIGAFYRYCGRPDVFYTWPSLVDHADGQTLITHRPDRRLRTQRHAHRVGTPAQWTTEAVASA